MEEAQAGTDQQHRHGQPVERRGMGAAFDDPGLEQPADDRRALDMRTNSRATAFSRGPIGGASRWRPKPIELIEPPLQASPMDMVSTMSSAPLNSRPLSQSKASGSMSSRRMGSFSGKDMSRSSPHQIQGISW